jgi:RNA polymerase sigma-70 factor (ECF subfamily)
MASLFALPSSRADRPSGSQDVSPATRLAQASDAELCELASQGDLPARSELFVRNKRGVARIIASLLGPDAEGEDVVHETFLRAFALLDRCGANEAIEQLGPWLRGVAVFVAREWLRKKARRRWSLFEDVPERPTHEVPAGVRDALRETFEVLARLPVDDRLAFSLRYIEGLEITELALAMDLSLSTSKRRLRAAEERFRALAAKRPNLREYLEADS